MNYSGDKLREYLSKEEVADIMYTFVDEEKQLRMLLAREREESWREGYEEGFREGHKEGRIEGRRKGAAMFPELVRRLLELGRDDDLLKACSDGEFRYELYREFGIGLDNDLSIADNDDPGLEQDNDSAD